MKNKLIDLNNHWLMLLMAEQQIFGWHSAKAGEALTGLIIAIGAVWCRPKEEAK